MRRWLWVPICCAALAVPVVVMAASDREFDGVVSAIEHEYHVHATRIPFMSLASFVSRKATNGGVSGVRIGEFDHFDKAADGEELNRMMEEKLGAGWQRIIRDTSRHGNEQTLIFAHPDGKRMGLFILDLDGHELDVVQVSVDPDHLNETIGTYDRRNGDEGGESE
jgi:hypothetical protein